MINQAYLNEVHTCQQKNNFGDTLNKEDCFLKSGGSERASGQVIEHVGKIVPEGSYQWCTDKMEGYRNKVLQRFVPVSCAIQYFH